MVQMLAAYSLYNEIHHQVKEFEVKSWIIEHLLSRFATNGLVAIMKHPHSDIQEAVLKVVVSKGSISPNLLPGELKLVILQTR